MKRNFWLITGALIILLAALCILRVSPFKLYEQDIIASLQSQQSPTSITFFQIISDYGKYINIGIPAIFLIIGLWLKKKNYTRNALIVLLAMAFSGIIAQSIKRTVKEPRPYEVDSRITQYSVGGSNSFPSGHTAETSVAALGFMILLFGTPRSRAASIPWMIIMMMSRIVLGVHNFTDIIGGFVTACLGLYVVYNLFEKYAPGYKDPVSLKI
ncbi:MAG: phosphatase PAP2 family protein [Cyclobacteriaceae bacterium]|nr:phosphatase PAP2 family protein [Cyclobacteriaceae bacterium]